MESKTHRRLLVAGLLAIAAHTGLAATTQITSTPGCFANQNSTTGAPLSGSGRCRSGSGTFGSANADLQAGDLKVLATTTGFGNAEARAFYRTDLLFVPGQVVPITVTMHLTGSITGGLAPSNSFLFQAAVHNFLDFGVVGGDTLFSGFQVTPNGHSGMGSFKDDIVSVSGTMLRDNLDLTLTYTHTWLTDSFPISIGGYIDAQVVPLVPGVGMSSDFSHTASVTFSVPPGTQFTSEGFLLPTQPVPEPSTLLLLGSGLGVTAWLRKRRPAAMH